MKEFDVALKAVADGLRTIAQGMGKIAEKLEESTPKTQPKAKRKPARKTKTKPAPKAKAVAKPKAKPKKTAAKKAPAKKATAADTVLAIITGSKKGVNTAFLAEKTGYDKKKIANIIFKLRKMGKIKSVGRGVYTKA
ncbi:hypothetical protein ACFL2E_03790 [Thermodesulfobacteriota bacterium]